MRKNLLLCTLLFIVCASHGYSQSGPLAKSRIPFYYSLIPFHLSKDSLPNMVTIDYQFHAGSCQLRDGKTIRGFFSFAPYAKKFNFFYGNKLKRRNEVYYKVAENSLPDSIYHDKISRLALAGKDSSVYTNVDSTIFIYNDIEDALLRLRSDKPVRFYDDQLIVDELCTRHLTFWKETAHFNVHSVGFGTNTMSGGSTTYTYSRAKAVWEWVDAAAYRQLRSTDEIFYEWQGGIVKIRNWKDVKGIFPIDPYIQDVAEVFHRNRQRDVAFGILFSSAEDKLSLVPFFKKIEIVLANGTTLKGSGFIQPFRDGTFYKTGYVHFHDGKNFSLIRPEEIQTVMYGNNS